MANGRSVKCRYCGTSGNSLTAHCIKDGIKNVYFCNEEHYNLWKVKADLAKVENEQWIECYEYVKNDVMGYDARMQLPKYLVTRLQDLRNGIAMDTTTYKKVKKSKDGYPYKVITLCFKSQLDTIMYWFRNKAFKNENQKINYMMAIIEGSINDEYLKWKRNEKLTKEAPSVDIDTMNIEVETPSVIKIENEESDLRNFFNYNDL